MLPQCVSWTEGPSNISSLVEQRERWQRVVIEMAWEFRTMLLNPRYGTLAFLTLPYYLFYEVLGVFIELASIAFILVGWWLGVLDIRAFVAISILMISSQVISSFLSVSSFMRSQRLFPTAYVIYLMLLSVVEFLCYRWIISFAKIYGTVNYFRGIKKYNQYARAKRTT